MAEINSQVTHGNSALEEILRSILTDLTALKTAVDASKTLTDELHDDHATFKTAVDSLKTLADEIKADHNALLAKLDADAGVTDTDYASLHTTAAADASAAPGTLTASKQTAVGALGTTTP